MEYINICPLVGKLSAIVMNSMVEIFLSRMHVSNKNLPPPPAIVKNYLLSILKTRTIMCCLIMFSVY